MVTERVSRDFDVRFVTMRGIIEDFSPMKWLPRSTWLFCALFVLAGCSTDASRQRAERLLPREALQADADVLEHSYKSLHPGLARYNTPAEIDRHFADLKRSLDHDQSLGEAYLHFSEFAGTVRCGHTYANFYNQPKIIQQSLFEAPDRLPFYFVWRSGRMIVTRNFSSDARLTPGTEVRSINGRQARSLLDGLIPLSRADGGNDAKRIANLEVEGKDRYEAFDVYAPLRFPDFRAPFNLEFESAGQRFRLSVAGQTFAQRLSARPQQVETGPVWSVSQPAPHVALLSMPTWAMYNNPWDWKRALDEMFNEFEREADTTLIIDLRANEGGDDVGNRILAHLESESIRPPHYSRLVRYRRVDDALAPYLDTWDRSFFDWGDAAIPDQNGFFRLTRYDDDEKGDRIDPVAPRFTGRVVVLIGPTNSSATFQFIQTIQATKRATLVGGTTGGNLQGINGGAFFFLRLPHSGIELDIPLIGRFPDEPQPDAGIRPDVFVESSIDDIASGHDAVLDKALTMAETN